MPRKHILERRRVYRELLEETDMPNCWIEVSLDKYQIVVINDMQYDIDSVFMRTLKFISKKEFAWAITIITTTLLILKYLGIV